MSNKCAIKSLSSSLARFLLAQLVVRDAEECLLQLYIGRDKSLSGSNFALKPARELLHERIELS
jgi:hypothetical protein